MCLLRDLQLMMNDFRFLTVEYISFFFIQVYYILDIVGDEVVGGVSYQKS